MIKEKQASNTARQLNEEDHVLTCKDGSRLARHDLTSSHYEGENWNKDMRKVSINWGAKGKI